MDFDDILPALGGFGRYQIILYCALLIPANFPLAFVVLSYAFVSATPDHWCEIPELESRGLPSDIVKNLSLPRERRDGESVYSQCQMYDVNYTQVAINYLLNNLSTPNTSWPVINCRHGWNYDRSTYYNTLVTEMNVVCSRKWMTTLSNSMFYVGTVFSQLLFGYIGDRWGRKPSFFIMLFSLIIFGLLSCFPPNYIAYIVYRGILGFVTSSCYLTPFVLITEFTVPNKRCITGMICGIVFSLALIIYTGIAYLLRDWFYISLMYCVPFVPLLAYWWLLSESPRWLISQNREDEAELIVQKIAKVNKKQIENNFLKKFIKEKKPEEIEKAENTSHTSLYLEILKYPNMRRRQFILCFDWAVISLTYTVLLFSAMNMRIDEYLANAINSFSEIPGIFIIMIAMDTIGRRMSLFLSMGIAGLGCLSVIFVSSDQVWIAVVLANIGKAGISGAFCLVFVYGCELFPTSLRNSAISLPYLMGGISTIFSPYILTLSAYGRTIPLVMIGILSLAGALAGLFLPETLNVHLPQTIEDGENLGMNNCSCFLFWKRKKDVYTLEEIKK